jgi:CRISPR system Cascade subunit CasD
VIKMRTLLLKFAGPLQSWGTDSDFEIRHTDLYPSKSAVIGLIAASLGYRRNDDERIQKLNKLDFAVRIDQNGNVLRDYHTAKSGEVLRTYVTNRYYIEDGAFSIALGHDNNELIEEISYAIQNPYFQTYMGRRALPLNSDFYIGIVGDDVISSLEDLPWQASDWYKKNNNDIDSLTIYADSHLLANKGKHYRKDEVVSFDQKSRTFTYRYESRDKITLIKEEHDAFEALGD